MNKNVIAVLVIILILITIIGVVFINLNKNKNNNTVSQILFNTKQYINSNKKIKIDNTEDLLIITQNVKWDPPKSENGETISFSVAIPYTFIVDGKDYKGTYILNSNSSSKTMDDNNPKYNLEITNLTKNGEIEVLITEK